MPLVFIVTNGQIKYLEVTRNAPFDDKLRKEATWRILRPFACVVAGQDPIEAIAKYHSPMRGQQLFPRVESRRVNQPRVPILLPKGRIEGVIVWLGESIGNSCAEILLPFLHNQPGKNRGRFLGRLGDSETCRRYFFQPALFAPAVAKERRFTTCLEVVKCSIERSDMRIAMMLGTIQAHERVGYSLDCRWHLLEGNYIDPRQQFQYACNEALAISRAEASGKYRANNWSVIVRRISAKKAEN